MLFISLPLFITLYLSNTIYNLDLCLLYVYSIEENTYIAIGNKTSNKQLSKNSIFNLYK